MYCRHVLNLLYNIVNLGLPWPLGSFENKRSFCSIDNFCFIIKELIDNEHIPSGVYNVADDEPISTNDIIKFISETQGRKVQIWKIPQFFIKTLSKFGDLFYLKLNTERLNKLTESYVVSSYKMKNAIQKSLPISAKDGLKKTIKEFGKNKLEQ